MPDKVQLRATDIIRSTVMASSADGQAVFELIASALAGDSAVEVSFAGRQTIIPAFLNAAIGQLYDGSLPEETLRDKLSFVDLDANDLAMIERTISNAKRYFANRKAFDAAWAEVDDEGP